jgi:hypothetical protein
MFARALTGLALLAALALPASAQVKATNPLNVTVGNFPATQPVTQGGAWTFGLNGPIPAGTNTIGNIGNAFALDATAQAGNASTAAIATATGAPADAASASGANTSVIGALRAIRDRILSTLTVSGTVTANVGTTNGLALDASVQGVRTALGSPLQAGGSIGNTAFGITGTLPPYAATPTFNLGTLNGAATAAAQATGNTSVASIDTKTPTLGTQAKAASRSVTPASDLANIEPAGAPITGAAMPAGGTGITGWLSAVWRGIVSRQTYLVDSSTNLAANGFLGAGNYLYLGGSPSPYTYVVANFYSNQPGTYVLQVSDGTNVYPLETGTLAASTLKQVRLPAAPVSSNTSFRGYIQNGGTAASLAFMSVSLMAN